MKEMILSDETILQTDKRVAIVIKTLRTELNLPGISLDPDTSFKRNNDVWFCRTKLYHGKDQYKIEYRLVVTNHSNNIQFSIYKIMSYGPYMIASLGWREYDEVIKTRDENNYSFIEARLINAIGSIFKDIIIDDQANHHM